MNIPLGGFSWTNNATDTCIIALQELPSTNVILGTLFWTEFFSVFTNDYNTDPPSVS
jgi:hypothetical protein